MTDRLTLTRAFEGAGMQSAAAERIATEIYDGTPRTLKMKKELYPVTIGATTLLAAPLPLLMRARPELGATIGCPVNAMARRAHLPGSSFGNTLAHQPEFFTFWSSDIAQAEWSRRWWYQRRFHQWRWLRQQGANPITAFFAAMSMSLDCDPLAATHEALADALHDPEKLRALLQP